MSDAFNLREAAKAPYRGLTALVQGKPYLIIDKEDDHYILEGEDGDILKLERFAWVEGQDSDKLVAASRLEGSGLEFGTVIGNLIVGRLVNDDGVWYVRSGLSDVALPLEQIVDALEAGIKLAWDENDVSGSGSAEIKWFVTPEGEVLLEDPSNPVPNHLALVQQQKGRDYIRQYMASPNPVNMGLQGTLANGDINVGGYLMSDASSPPRNLDPAKSWPGHVRVRNAVHRVRDEATARGLPVNDQHYHIPIIRPGQGVSTRPRPFTASLRGTFVDHNTGEEVEFYELSHEPVDRAAGVGERWEIESTNGHQYTLRDDGSVEDEKGNLVGHFDPYAKVGSFKTAATFQYALPPLGLHFRTHNAMRGAGLTAIVHYPPGITKEFPEGFTSVLPSGSGMDDMLISADYPDEHDGQSIEGVPVTVETSDDPALVTAVLDGLGGREVPNLASLPDNVRSTIEALTMRKGMTHKEADQITDLYTDEEKKALKCPKCGSHTLRAYDVTQSKTMLKCLTCGNEFPRKTFKNPEASTKEADGYGTAPQYPIDPQLQQIAQATDPTQKQQLQQQLEQLLGGSGPGGEWQQQLQQQQPAQPSQPLQPTGMRGFYETPNAVDRLRHDIIVAAGLSRVSLDQNDRVNHIINVLLDERGGNVPQKDLQTEDYGQLVAAGANLLRDSFLDTEGEPNPNDTLEGLGMPPEEQDYYRDASVDGDEIPDWFMIRLNEELTNEILRESGILKGAPYPENSYKNAPDHTPKGQKSWPKEVNAVYNACMREGNGKGDSKDEKESSCAAIAWAQYKKTQKDSKQAAEAHTPGTRVEVVHPSNKGQKGSILKLRGKDSATEEETYDVQLDNGEKAEGLRASDFKRIKSARRVDSASVADVNSTENHFIESMTFTAEHPLDQGPSDYAQPYWPTDDDFDFEPDQGDDTPACPMCGGPGEYLGTLGSLDHFRCRNCGAQFNTRGGVDFAGYGDQTGDPAEWAERGLRGGKVADGGWPKGDQPKNPNGLPDSPSFDGNKTKFPYDPPAQDAPYDEPDLSGGDTTCPNCGSSAKNMGELNARTYHECSKCHMQFSLPNSDESQKWAPDGPEEMFGQDKPRYFGATDVSGGELREGSWYIMHSRDYKVPDVIKIVKLDGDHITAHFETDKDGKFPLQIQASDLDKFSFDPYQRSDDPIEIDEHAQKSASGWSTTARRNFSPKEQRDLVDENLEARARNYDKLNLEGTHYQMRDTSFSLLDRDFLWGV
jgi:transposase-like protein/transcription elongation factor Elf1